MQLVPMGDLAWRIELPPGIDHRAVLRLLRGWPGVGDAVVADRHALVRFEAGKPPADPRAALANLTGVASEEPALHIIRARYDGPDLEEVARVRQITTREVVELHARLEYTVQMVGFLPGFAYLGPVADALQVPRRATPRLRVPAGSIGLAAGRTAVYPLESPGGWSLIGRAVGFEVFNPESGATLKLGDRVRFEPIP